MPVLIEAEVTRIRREPILIAMIISMSVKPRFVELHINNLFGSAEGRVVRC